MILGFSLKNCFAHHPYFGITHTILGTIWWETIMVCQIFFFVALLIFFLLLSFGLFFREFWFDPLLYIFFPFLIIYYRWMTKDRGELGCQPSLDVQFFFFYVLSRS